MGDLDLTIRQTGVSNELPAPLSVLKLFIRQDSSVGTLEDDLLTDLELATIRLIESSIGYPLVASEMTATFDLPYDLGVSHATWMTQWTWRQQFIPYYPFMSNGETERHLRLRGPVYYAPDALGVLTSVTLYDTDNNANVIPAGTGYIMLGEARNVLVFIDPSIVNVALRHVSAMVIKYNAGWAIDQIPRDLLMAVKQTVADWYDNRARVGSLPAGVMEILHRHSQNLLS